jgi:hypothetical protein
VTARRIARLITENKDKPFFIACGFRKPHLPLYAPLKYFDMYNLADIRLPRTPANDLDDIPLIALTCTNSDNFLSGCGADADQNVSVNFCFANLPLCS